MKVQAIVFDLDGTLAETEEIKRAAFNLAFRDTGHSWVWAPTSWARLRTIPADEDKIRLFAKANELPALTKRQIKQILSKKDRGEVELLETGVTSLRPGVARLITEARLNGLKMAVCARSGRMALDHLLFNRFGPDGFDWFDAMVTADDFEREPSAMEAYARLLPMLDVDPACTVAIESGEEGVNAAALSGLTVIATPGIYSRLDDFSRAHLVVSDLGHPSAPFELLHGDAQSYGFVCVPALDAWLPEMRRAA